MRIYIGFDAREEHAYSVAEKSARAFGCDTQPLYEERLRLAGLLTRPKDTRGQHFDFVSGASQSTDFAIARFFVPLLAHSGYAMFVDCDVVFMADPNQLMRDVDPSKAVYCVKHRPMELGGTKMDGQAQTSYPRKLWSSVCIFNADHPANRRLNLTALNCLPGRDLHAFCWLHDSEIGELPAEANWLVEIQPKPSRPIIAHFTNGGPWLGNWRGGEHDDLWRRYADEYASER